MGPEIDETAPATDTAPTTTIPDVDIIRREKEEENKKRTAVNDLKNRLEYQQAKNDKEILKEIMTRVSAKIFYSNFLHSSVTHRLMIPLKKMRVMQKKNLFISKSPNVH